MTSFGAVLDANVLVPMAARDTLLRAAEAGLYRPFWSNDILDEAERTLLRLFAEDEHADPERQAKRIIAHIRAAFPESIVTGYNDLIPVMRNDEKDRHVLAAAITSQAQMIVTSNVRHFLAPALAPYQIEALTPDDFLCDLFDLGPGLLCDILRQQAGALQRPTYTMSGLLDHLGRHVPNFVSAVRQHLSQHPPC